MSSVLRVEPVDLGSLSKQLRLVKLYRYREPGAVLTDLQDVCETEISNKVCVSMSSD
jgi:hypothetical protein